MGFGEKYLICSKGIRRMSFLLPRYKCFIPPNLPQAKHLSSYSQGIAQGPTPRKGTLNSKCNTLRLSSWNSAEFYLCGFGKWSHMGPWNMRLGVWSMASNMVTPPATTLPLRNVCSRPCSLGSWFCLQPPSVHLWLSAPTLYSLWCGLRGEADTDKKEGAPGLGGQSLVSKLHRAQRAVTCATMTWACRGGWAAAIGGAWWKVSFWTGCWRVSNISAEEEVMRMCKGKGHMGHKAYLNGCWTVSRAADGAWESSHDVMKRSTGLELQRPPFSASCVSPLL